MMIKRIRIWSTEHPIIAGLIATAIVGKPLEYLVVAVSKYCGSVGVILIDGVFFFAATSSLYLLVVNVVFAVFIFFAMQFTFKIIKVYGDMGRELKECADIEKSLISLKNRTEMIEEKNEPAPTIEDRCESLIQRNTTASRNLRKNKREIVLLSVIGAFMIVGYALYMIAPHIFKASFDSAITTVRPYTTEAQVSELESQWVQMKNYADYAEIDQALKEIKAKAGLGD